MKIENHRWFSPCLGKEMSLNVYGHCGKPVIVFPSSGGSFHEFADFGMIHAIEGFIEQGRVVVFTPDSVDKESWLNNDIPPVQRAQRHNAYDSYIVEEVLPLATNISQRTDMLGTGCSLGAYHAMNFFLRHPDVFDTVIALSGCYQLSDFVGEDPDVGVYLNSPLRYLPNCEDPWFIDRYRRSRIIACTGQGAWEEVMIRDLHALSAIFASKGIAAWCDFWGYDVNHDWPWWRVQLPYFLGHVV